MIPLFTTQQVRQGDSYAINKLKIPGIVLMENAALSIYENILDNVDDISLMDRIGIIAGKGNNGGDGFAVARHLINSGFTVIVISLATDRTLKGDALTNYKILKNLIKITGQGKLLTYKSLSDIDKFRQCSVIIDAILGTGTKGGIREPYASIITKINSFDAFKIAVDIPSGLNADTGYGEIIFEADITVTLAEFKRGLFIGKGSAYSGEVIKGNIGIGSEFFDNMDVRDYSIEPEDAFNGLPAKFVDEHKYSSGKVLTIAGSGKLPGAAFFTANSTQKVGCGASVLAFPKSLKETAVNKLDASTLIAYEDNGTEFLREENLPDLEEKIGWADVIALGPGIGREKTTLQAVYKLLNQNSHKFFVIDADALYGLGNGRYKKINLTKSVLTPHHKEFADLIGISVDKLQQDLLGYGNKFVNSTGSTLVLKGAPTIIFTGEGDRLINTTGNPGMAKFGMGDVLTGAIAGFIAQSGEIESSVISAVYLHSLSADLLREENTVYGFTATELMNNLPKAIKFLADSIIQNYR